MPPDFKNAVAYYIANKITIELPVDIDRSAKINAIIKFIVNEQISNIGTELYRFARYANLLAADNDLFQTEEFEEFARESIERLPTPAGVSLSNPIWEDNYFVQYAKDEQGKSYYYEHIDERELNKIGGSLLQYRDAIQRLIYAKMILPAVLDLTIKKGILIILTPVTEDVMSLYDYLETHGGLLPEEVFRLVEKTVTLVEDAIKLFSNSALRIFVPVPSLHTVYIGSDRNLLFGNVSLTIGSEKRYIAKTGKTYPLQSEDPLMESFGLLYFELATGLCAVEELIRSKAVDKVSSERFTATDGILFVEIIRKATRPVISERYTTLRFFTYDAGDWSKLETVILDKQKVSDDDAFFLRAIWNLEIFINRRVVSEFKNNLSILLYAHQIQKAIINYIVKNDIHRRQWLWETWTVINDNEKYRKHIAAHQAIVFGEQIEQKVNCYHTALHLSKEINFPLWLYASAVHVELESLRRSLHGIILKEPSLEEFTICKDSVLDCLSQNIEVSLFLDKPNDRLVEAVNIIQANLSDTFNRLDVWLKSPTPPPANWIHDNLLIMFIVIGKLYGMSLVTSDGEAVAIKRSKKMFNKIDYLLFIQELLSVVKNDIANSGKDKPVNGIRYAVFVQGRLRDVNIQLLRDVHRYFDILGSTIYLKFKFRETVLLKIRSLKKPFSISKDIVIDENHNHEDVSLAEGCPYSLDIEQIKRSAMVPLTASFPIVTGKWQTEKLHPVYAEYKFSSLKRIRLRYQRRNPVWSAFLDAHLLVAFLTPLIYLIGVLIFSETGPHYGLVLNGVIYVFLNVPLVWYVVVTYKKLMGQNPEYKEIVSNLLGGVK